MEIRQVQLKLAHNVSVPGTWIENAARTIASSGSESGIVLYQLSSKHL